MPPKPAAGPPLRLEITVSRGRDPAQIARYASSTVLDVPPGAFYEVNLPSLGALVVISEGGVAFGHEKPKNSRTFDTTNSVRAITWEQVSTFVRTGEMSSSYYGVTIDGKLVKVYASESQAADRATDARATSGDVRVIRVPAELAGAVS